MSRMAENWIRLLGPPAIESPGATPLQPRGRKAWAVLAYLALQADGTGRSRTASLLFPDAVDPLGALRWNLSELRRTLDGVTMAGDPLRLALQPPWRCDALEVVDSAGSPGVDPRRFNGQLLEGLSFADSPVFDSWLADQRYRLDNCVQSLLYEAALAALASGVPAARPSSWRRWRCSGIRSTRTATPSWSRRSWPWASTAGPANTSPNARNLYRQELGLPLPAEVRRALSDAAPEADPGMPATAATVRSYLDAGGASLWAGAVDRGLDQLRLAVVLAQRTGDDHLLAESLVTLSGALIHQAGGRGAEVADFLHRALSGGRARRRLPHCRRRVPRAGVPVRAARCARTARPAGWTGRCRRPRDSRTNRPGFWRSRACWPRTPRGTRTR